METKIKRGWNFYWYYLTVFVLIGFIAINYYSRNFKIEGLDTGLMISVVSFIFGFLISLKFSMSINKTATLKKALSVEAGRLVSLYLLSKQLGKEFHEKIKELVDEYTIHTLRDYYNYETGRESIYSMYEDLDKMELKNEKQSAVANSFLYILGELEPAREELEYLTKKDRGRIFRSANYILGGILIILLFLNRGDNFTNIIFIVLSTVIVFLFLIIEDYDSLKIVDYSANISNSEQIFDLIGKERYYPQGILGRVRLEAGKHYRIGIYDKEVKGEKIYLIQYNPSFKLSAGSVLRGLHKIPRFGRR